MAPDRQQHIQKLLREAQAKPAPQRSAFLDKACGEDRAARLVVESILNRELSSVAPVDRRQGAISTKKVPAKLTKDPLIGIRIDQFRIKRHIGSGGMGTVYQAIQENPRRVVALKVMLRGLASSSAMRRLAFEAQLLGRLHHPGIAQVYQAGTWDTGYGEVPYFAMEYIPNARTLTEFAQLVNLSTRGRLETFEKVCDAVHHGHQKGIIHRDLKPANILVDSSGEPKVIDFGVARSTDSDLAVTTLQTDVGQIMGTLQYMSPEQCEGDPHDIDTRSDVYTLGVILYELICDRLPYDVSDVSIPDAARLIRESTPAKPSSIDRMLGGDLEIITMKALEKDRRLRYQSAIELAQDIRRYLNNEPIAARPPSMRYQLRRFARQNRWLFLATAAAAVMLVAGAAVALSILLSNAREEIAKGEQAQLDAQELVAKAQQDAREEVAEVQAAAYRNHIAAANEAALRGDSTAVRAHLHDAPTDLRGWEWKYLDAQRTAIPLATGDRAFAVALDHSGSNAIVAMSTGVELWSLGREPIRVKKYESARSIAVSPDWKQFATGLHDGTVRVRPIEGKGEHWSQEMRRGPVIALTYSGNQELLAGASQTEGWIWWPDTAGRKSTLEEFESRIQAIALNDDASLLAIGFEDGTIRMHHPGSNRKLWQLQVHEKAVMCLEFDRDGRLASGSEDGTVCLIGADSDYTQWQVRDSGPVYAVAFHPDGSRIASGTGDGTVRIWDAATGDWILTLRGHEDRVASLSFSRDGSRLASASWDKTVRVWGAAKQRSE